MQPVFDLFAPAAPAVGERGGCIRGLPRARLIRTGSVGEIGGSSGEGSSFTSANWSSVSSTLGIISLESVRLSNRSSDCVFVGLKMFESKLGVVKGDSLADDMEGCGEELVLKRACAPGGGWPKETLEIIRPSNEVALGTIGERRYALDVQSVLRKDNCGSDEMILQTRLSVAQFNAQVEVDLYTCRSMLIRTAQVVERGSRSPNSNSIRCRKRVQADRFRMP